MGGKDPGPATTSSTSRTTQELSPEQQQVLGLAMPGVTQFAATVPQRYQGSQIAGFTPEQQAAQSMALSGAANQAMLGGAGGRTADFWLSDAPWRPENNPALRGAIEAGTRPIREQLTESTLPAIRSGAQAVGGFGGSRQGIAEGLASREASRATGDVASKIAQQQYQTNVEAQLRALGMIPQTQEAQLAAARTTGAVGDVNQAMNQALLSEQVGQFNYDQLAPYLQSKELLSILGGLPGGSTVATGQATGPAPPQQSGLMKGLGGAATGASLGSMFGPIGMGVGALGGAALSFL